MYPGAGKQLFTTDPVFRQWMHDLDEVAVRRSGRSIVKALYSEGLSREGLTATSLSHPAVFMLQWSLFQSLANEGVKPSAVAGSSLGEYVALTAAGALSPFTALELVIDQSKLFERTCPAGGMLAVLHDRDSLAREILGEGLELAGEHGPVQAIYAGDVASLKAAARRLREAGGSCQELPVSIGFHSSLIEPARRLWYERVAALDFEPLRLNMVSGVDGRKITRPTSDYLWRIVREPMRLFAAVRTLLQDGVDQFVDISPSGTLRNLLCQAGLVQVDRVFAVMTPFPGDRERYDQLRELLAPRDRVDNGSRKESDMTAFVFPGQGAQHKGMGGELFRMFPELAQTADKILGYSIEKLCLSDPEGRLSQTSTTQPALFIVNALSYLAARREGRPEPRLLAGHSLGEYNALFAAGVFDFATGLRLVHKRGELMARAPSGSMAAVIGIDRATVTAALREAHQSIDVANDNSPRQVVIAGPPHDLLAAEPALRKAGARAVVPLRVSGAFHSRYMSESAQEFAVFLRDVVLQKPRIPVLANCDAQPYEAESCKEKLALQIHRPVMWTRIVESIRAAGLKIEEIGPGRILTNLLKDFPTAPQNQEDGGIARQDDRGSGSDAPAGEQLNARSGRSLHIASAGGALAEQRPSAAAERLGSAEFRRAYGVRLAYVAGAMYRGIASEALVVAMGRAGLLSFFGAGGLPPSEIERAIVGIQRELGAARPYGMNLLATPMDPALEERIVDLYLQYGIRNAEAASYLTVTPALVRYRLKGVSLDSEGNVVPARRIIAKVSRPEVAQLFLSPPPERIVGLLRAAGKLTAREAELAGKLPLADDLCVEADSGGHTDLGSAPAITPVIIRLRDQSMRRYGYSRRVHVGAAGGLGTPEAIAAALMLGADFVVTGSVNQCTMEANTSDAVKDLLQGLSVQDFAYAPAGDLFELGAKVQVVRKGLFFPARATKLYELYKFHDSLDAIEPRTKLELETRYFKKTIAAVYEDVKSYYGPDEIARAEANPKHKMALVFKWYFGHSSRAAMQGASDNRIDYQVHSGPALGAFNQWVGGTPLESWRNRHVADIAERLMSGAAKVFQERWSAFEAAARFDNQREAASV